MHNRLKPIELNNKPRKTRRVNYLETSLAYKAVRQQRGSRRSTMNQMVMHFLCIVAPKSTLNSIRAKQIKIRKSENIITNKATLLANEGRKRTKKPPQILENKLKHSGSHPIPHAAL